MKIREFRRTIPKQEKKKLCKFYQYVSENTEHMGQFGKWIYGLHPTTVQIETYIQSGFMYTVEEGGEILGAVAITPFQGVEYRDADWQMACRDIPAHRLYQSLGFQQRSVCNWYADNVGNAEFYLFELLL